MKIIHMSISNFKGIKGMGLHFEDLTNIVGDNGTGKTSIYDAWLWLLFGKDSFNRSDFEIKPINQHNLETSVEATVEYDGKTHVFKRIYAEKWSKGKMVSHTTQYYYNDVKKDTKADYQGILNSIIPDNIFKILSNPNNFNKVLTWQQRRAILFELQDTAPISPDSQFANLIPIFEKYTPAEYKKKLSQQESEINKRLLPIPIGIRELQNIAPEQGDNLDAELATLKKALTTFKPIQNTKALDIQNKINNLKVLNAQEEATKLDGIAFLRTRLEPVVPLADLVGRLHACNDNLDSTRTQWKDLFKLKWDATTNCPVCKQKLPDEDIAKSEALFNENKANSLKQLDRTGQEYRKEFEDIEKELKKVKENNLKAEKGNKDIQIKIAEITEKENGQDSEISRLKESLSSISLVDEEQAAIERSDGLNAELQIKISAVEEKIAKQLIYEQSQARISELSAQEKDLGIELAEVQDKILSVDNFIHQQVVDMESGINDNFAVVKFKVFDEQINGTISDTCIATVNDVPYSDLNGASKIQAGLDIIRTLQVRNNIKIPIFIDNRESITDIPDMGDTQIINLIVDPDEKVLRVM